MDFTYDDEQTALRDAVRGLVGKAYGDYEQRRTAVAEDSGFDEKTWARLAEMGLLGLPFAEDDGGVGAGPVEIGIVGGASHRRTIDSVSMIPSGRRALTGTLPKH